MQEVGSEASTIALSGKSIARASNSLTRFVMAFQDGTGLILDAVMQDGMPALSTTAVSANDIGSEADAVCKVDWSWIASSEIEQAAIGKDQLKLSLNPAGPLVISVQLWQGKPFLAFQPFRPAR